LLLGHSPSWHNSPHKCPHFKTISHGSPQETSLEQLTRFIMYRLQVHNLFTLKSHEGHGSSWHSKGQGWPQSFMRLQGLWQCGLLVPQGKGGWRAVFSQTQVIGCGMKIGHALQFPRWQKRSQLCEPQFNFLPQIYHNFYWHYNKNDKTLRHKWLPARSSLLDGQQVPPQVWIPHDFFFLHTFSHRNCSGSIIIFLTIWLLYK
jgi:hypothetical protein